MRSKSSSVVDIIAEMEPWVEELMLLREIILSTGLKEEIKWGGPNYSLDGKKLMAIGGFKNYASIWFHHGVFLSDPAKVLINANEARTKGLRQWRFASMKEIKPPLVKKYVLEAIKNAKEGKEIKPEKKAAIAIPAELQAAFKKDKLLKAAFDGLTPGRQREYLEYISEAKGEDTRLRRVAKCAPIILAGMGLNEKYK
ncbi:MAG: YdeI/OmpD-associated family protein [Saprospiraceae bacterium]|nr:YdeI/OmpD-associated family protein [Candidatus Opimibacter iunctus]